VAETSFIFPSTDPQHDFLCHSVPVDVLWSIMVNDRAGSRIFFSLVLMRYAKLQMPSWKTGIIKAVRAIPLALICDVLLLVFILMGLIIVVVAPIWLSVVMPTGS
jgi:hypothetical protein